MDQGNFVEFRNSFLNTVFTLNQRSDLQEPPAEQLQELSSISALYIYSNPPPMGYGTPAPKVVESVLRAYSMNKNPPNNRTIVIDGYSIVDPVWHGDEKDFPWFEPANNFCPSFVYESALAFMQTNGENIIRVINDVMTDYATRNSDELTKGRQTYCPLTDSSLPCPRAYKNMVEFMQRNGAPSSMSILGMIMEFFKLMRKPGLEAPIIQYTKITKKVRIGGKTHTTSSNRRKIKWTRIIGDEQYKFLMNIARTFCTYIKHGERSHLERRAIASPNIIKRAFLSIIEEVHGRLGKLVEGSTISIGGEEKKNKIISTVESLLADAEKLIRKQGTEDATKWNETLSAALFGMIQKTFLDPQSRRSIGLPPPTKFEEVYHDLAMSSHFILSIKRVTLGPGLQGKTELFHGEIPFTEEGKIMVNAHTNEWLGNALPLIEEGRFLNASPGMLMGMHNTLSTTVGLVPVNMLHESGSLCKVLRSSDDSMSMHAGSNEEEVMWSIDLLYMELKLNAIAMSPKKTMVFKERFGEFTSWFQDEKLVSQFGPETTTLRPLGRNPYDDVFGAAKGTAVSLLNCSSNPFGAEVKLTLALNNIRSLYSIHRVPLSDQPGRMVRVVADGGNSPYCIANCHLDESVIKEHLFGSGFDSYFEKIRNPLNPFSRGTEETVYFSKDIGALATDFMDTPATVFSYVKRGNRTVKCKTGISNAQSEEEAQKVVDLINNLDYSTALRIPHEATSSAEFCKTNLMLLRGTLDLTPEEQQAFDCAVRSLETGESQKVYQVEASFDFMNDDDA